MFSDRQTTSSLLGGQRLFTDARSNDSSDNLSDEADGAGWKVIIIDDEKDVHDVSRMVLSHFTYKDRGLEFIHGFSGREARELVEQHPDTAILLLDVVMESDDAGLETVKFIREHLENKTIRIILRTGQPGIAPEHTVVRDYDINDYLDKSSLTSQYLKTALVIALRSYDDICTIGQLSASNDKLEYLVKQRTRDLAAANDLLQKQMDKQRQSHEALQNSEAKLAEAHRIARIGYFEWTPGDDSMIWSEQTFRILGIDETEGTQTLDKFLSHVAFDDRSQVAATMREAATSLQPYLLEHRMQLAGGKHLYVRHQGDVKIDETNGDIEVVSILQDITDQHEAEIEMRKLSTAVEQTADGIMITDRDGIIEYVNPAMIEITGYPKAELVGQTPKILKSGEQGEAFYQRLWDTIKSGNVFNEVVINRKKNGIKYYEEKTITPQKNIHGEIISFISSGKDITERMEAQKRLHHLAHHDGLTGLPNRILLEDRLEQAITRARWRQRKIAVLFLDMDRFKVINDSLGHNVGDIVLGEMAQRLCDCVREGDTVARFGGDEFCIILNDLAEKADVPPLVHKLIESLSAPFTCEGRELFITTSIGISFFPEDGDTVQTLLKKSDAAMYAAKNKGRNGYQFYSKEEEKHSIERLNLESGLRRALEREEFELYCQPKLNLSNCAIDGYEVLLRWNHPEMGLISPAQFIPLLEETGMIIEVGEWVLATACGQEVTNQRSGLSPRKVAVNISIHQFRHQEFVQMVQRTLQKAGLDPKYLELEITEGVMIDDINETSAKLHRLHELGISISIDDFGTGYSSMSYLQRLPLDTLKIDRSFVTDMNSNSEDGAIAAAIITLAHSIGLDVVAEGVETIEQLKLLDYLGCDAIQGYLCSPPLPLAGFIALEDDFYSRWKQYLHHQET